MSIVLWNGRLFDPAAGEATERQVITIDGDTITSVGDVDGDPPTGRP